mmetsp:Transcript_26375/g.55084  ORF Transcript_26375/g.55084 Transcript_26375/m.55084 type:complete len:637 (-) Transcript_26375:24-1934(-)
MMLLSHQPSFRSTAYRHRETPNSVHHLLLLLLLTVPAAATGGAPNRNNDAMMMAGVGKLRPISSSIARFKRSCPSYHHPCFCSTTIPMLNSSRGIRFVTSNSGMKTSHPCFRSTSTHANQVILAATATPKNIGEAELLPSSPSFYQRTHSPKHILAPMVAQSDLPFRLMCEQLYDVHLSYTQMIHAHNFAEENGETFRTNHLDVYPQSIARDILLGRVDRHVIVLTSPQVNALKGLSEDDIEEARKRIMSAIARSQGIGSEPTLEIKPTVVQIASHDPDVAVRAAMMILERSGSMSCDSGGTSPVTAIDLNLGCPQSIARKGGYGAFLHDDSPDTTYSVLSKLRSKLPQEIGVTAKIRLPPTQAHADAGKLGNMSKISGPQTIDERMRCLIDCGVDLITVHGRTRFENKVTVGAADWDAVEQCVQSARDYSGDAHYPIFANGGIECYHDVKKCLYKTNASGVMSSESLLEVPGLFCPGKGDMASSGTAKDVLERQLGYADMYLDYATVFPPLSGSLGVRGGSFNVVRSHLFKFLHRYLEENEDLRSWLGDQALNTIKQARDLLTDLRSRYDKIDEEQLRLKNSWGDDSSWYRRHRRRNTEEPDEPIQLSIEERKQQAKLRIQKMKEQRMKKSVNTV